MEKKCRYSGGMTRVYLRKSFCLIGIMLACIGVAHTSEGEAAEQENSSTAHSYAAMQTVRFYTFEQIPDSAEVRETMIHSWFSAPIKEVAEKQSEVYTDSKGNRFAVSGKYDENSGDSFVISVIPDLTGPHVETHSHVPKGSWLLYRHADTGAPLCIKLYPAETPTLSISLRPAPRKAYSGKTFIDVSLFNAYVCKDIAVGIPFETLYHIPITRLKALTQAIIPWNLFTPPRLPSPVKKMTRIIEQQRHTLVSLKDGCFDNEGRPVHISTLEAQTDLEISAALSIGQIRSQIRGGIDSAGFAKWVVDGIVRPIAGEGTVIKSLKRSTEVPDTHFTRTQQEDEAIFFGLDWIRNLGAAALTLNLRHTVYPEDSGLDVTDCPFALTNTIPEPAEQQSAFLGYQKYAGYQTTYLMPLLYYLAITEPNHFYLACINSTHTPSGHRLYDRIAVFFPYFDSWGTFHLDIYEHGVPVPVDEFIKKNSNTYTALVRVLAPEEGLFNPQ